jgi:hypothetical protein
MANDDSSEQVRGLWRTQDTETFDMTPENIKKRILEIRNKGRVKSAVGYLSGLLVVAIFVWNFLVFRTLAERIGSFLTVLGAIYIVYQMFLQQRQARASSMNAEKMGMTSSVEFYRTELERRRSFHSGIWFWSRMVIFTPGPLIFMMGFAIAHPALAQFVRVDEIGFLILAVLAIPLNLRLAARYKREIDKIAVIR